MSYGRPAGLIFEHCCGFAVPPEDPAFVAAVLEQAAVERSSPRAVAQAAHILAENKLDRMLLAERWGIWMNGVLAKPMIRVKAWKP
ncbi:hypothetical protein [Azonexus sp.]|uniref:hypothetical protein n=1 Tax=Azonexus sp. TaxID=1872668 RepID=UPI0035B3A2D1